MGGVVTMPVFTWPVFMGNGRADAVEKVLWTHRTDDPTKTPRWLYLCGPDGAATQVLLAGGRACHQIEIPKQFAGTYSHGIHFANGVPAEIWALAALLRDDVLTLRRYPHLDCAIVLDWYKEVREDVDPMHWPNTPVGDLIYKGKYWKEDTPVRKKARTDLVEALADVITKHPLYRDAGSIVTIPGSKGDRLSFGERLASTVAKEVGKPLITTQAGAHEPRKAGSVVHLEDCKMPRIEGAVIVLDDVIKSGGTMSAVAQVARDSGASKVFGLAAVKTRSG
jgi:hypothetical protein